MRREGRAHKFNVQLALPVHIVQFRHQLTDRTVVGRGKGKQRGFFITGIIQRRCQRPDDHIRRTLTDRTGDEARLAEAATAAAAAHDLDSDTVLYDVDRRDDEAFRRFREYRQDALPYARTHTGMDRPDLRHGPVFVIDRLIEGGDINALDPRKRFKQLRPVSAGLFPILIAADDFREDIFPLTDGKGIDERRHRFRVEGGMPAGDHQRAAFIPL